MKKANVEFVSFDAADVIATSSVPATKVNTGWSTGAPKLTSYPVGTVEGHWEMGRYGPNYVPGFNYLDKNLDGKYNEGEEGKYEVGAIYHKDPMSGGFYKCWWPEDHY